MPVSVSSDARGELADMDQDALMIGSPSASRSASGQEGVAVGHGEGGREIGQECFFSDELDGSGLEGRVGGEDAGQDVKESRSSDHDQVGGWVPAGLDGHLADGNRRVGGGRADPDLVGHRVATTGRRAALAGDAQGTHQRRVGDDLARA